MSEGRLRVPRGSGPLHTHAPSAGAQVTLLAFATLEDRSGGYCGEREEKRGALAGLRRNPYAPAMSFYDLLADGQAYPRPRVLIPVVQSPEYGEDALGVLLVDPDSVVADREYPLAGFQPRPHMDGGARVSHEFQGVAYQVLEELG